jgi:uncharacterized protein (DUF4415 family)
MARKRTNPEDKRFRAIFNKGSYKSLNSYLDAVYKKNKTVIDSKIPSGSGKNQSSKTRFKRAVKEYMEEGKTANQALDALQKSRVFTSVREHYENNILKTIREDKDLFKKFRKMSGWNEKINPANMEYVESDDKITIYRYRSPNGSIVYIKVGKSPTAGMGATISLIRGEDFL